MNKLLASCILTFSTNTFAHRAMAQSNLYPYFEFSYGAGVFLQPLGYTTKYTKFGIQLGIPSHDHVFGLGINLFNVFGYPEMGSFHLSFGSSHRKLNYLLFLSSGSCSRSMGCENHGLYYSAGSRVSKRIFKIRSKHSIYELQGFVELEQFKFLRNHAVINQSLQTGVMLGISAQIVRYN